MVNRSRFRSRLLQYPIPMQQPKNQKKIPRDRDENGNHMSPFDEMLSVMDVEGLIRFRRRLEKVGRKRMVQILTEEIDRKQEEEKARHK